MSIIEETGALRQGDFTLSSGRATNVYFDARLVALHPHGSRTVAGLAWALVQCRGAEADDGPESGVLPMVGDLVHHSARFSREKHLKGFFLSGRSVALAASGSSRATWSRASG